MVTKRKPTIPATPFVETTATESVAPEAFSFDFNALMADLPDWKRIACAWTASLATSLGAGYLGAYFTGYMMVGAAVLTGSAFIVTCIYVLGMLLSIYAGYLAGVFVHVEIITEKIDARFNKAKSFVTGLFSNRKEVMS